MSGKEKYSRRYIITHCLLHFRGFSFYIFYCTVECLAHNLTRSLSHEIVSIMLLRHFNADVAWLTRSQNILLREYSNLSVRDGNPWQDSLIDFWSSYVTLLCSHQTLSAVLAGLHAKFSMLYLWRVSSTVVLLDISWPQIKEMLNKFCLTLDAACSWKTVSIPNCTALLCDYSLGHVHPKVLRKCWCALLLFCMSDFTERAW